MFLHHKWLLPVSSSAIHVIVALGFAQWLLQLAVNPWDYISESGSRFSIGRMSMLTNRPVSCLTALTFKKWDCLPYQTCCLLLWDLTESGNRAGHSKCLETMTPSLLINKVVVLWSWTLLSSLFKQINSLPPTKIEWLCPGFLSRKVSGLY